jgi:hypothetical protein
MEQFRERLGRRPGRGRPADEAFETAPSADEERIPATAAMRSATPGA